MAKIFSETDIEESVQLLLQLRTSISKGRNITQKTNKELATILNNLQSLQDSIEGLGVNIPKEISDLLKIINSNIVLIQKSHPDILEVFKKIRDGVKVGLGLARKAYNIVTIDNMTGLLSKNYLDIVLDSLWEEPKQDFYYLFLDLNNLKKINDTHGHQNGDKLINFFAHKLKTIFGTGKDYISRLQGDEFVIISFENKDEIQNKIQQLRELIDEDNFNIGDQTVDVGFGVGYARSSEFEYIRDMIRQADKKMYQDKYENKS